MMAMSQKQKMARLERQVAEMSQENHLTAIRKLERTGRITPKVGKQWRQALTIKNLSIQGNREVERILDRIEFSNTLRPNSAWPAVQGGAGADLSHTGATEVPAPEWAEGDEQRSQSNAIEEADSIVEMSQMAGVAEFVEDRFKKLARKRRR